MIFGLPAVLQSQYLALADAAGFARNQFAVNLELSTPETHVAGPNDDTLYGLGWLDLTQGPQVIEVPNTNGRYYSIELLDMWSNSFAYIGERTTGTQAGAFAISWESSDSLTRTGLPRATMRSSNSASGTLSAAAGISGASST